MIPTGKYQFESNSQQNIDNCCLFCCCDSYRKVPIWKQFTTGPDSLAQLFMLWFLQESTNLKAIHNQLSADAKSLRAVIPTGKYQFESNSQRVLVQSGQVDGCDSYRKVPIWKQFTTLLNTANNSKSCDSYRKVPIWKQFTTIFHGGLSDDGLWFLQESTNLKAIHNHADCMEIMKQAVIPTGKYQFESNSQQLSLNSNSSARCDSYRKVPIWKQFTTYPGIDQRPLRCDSYRKVPIWKQFTTLCWPIRWLWRLWFLQESTNLKAIHNRFIVGKTVFLAVIPTGKYQFESNSQRYSDLWSFEARCDSYRKVPIWKQFTTDSVFLGRILELWFLQESTNLKAIHNRHRILCSILGAVIPTGKYQFESNSQLLRRYSRHSERCDSYRKVPIWKQFTTENAKTDAFILLWFLQESTNLKAIHNRTIANS